MREKTKQKYRKDFLPQEFVEESSVILRAFKSLPKGTRSALLMSCMDDMEAEEIAYAMRVSEREVWMRLRDAQRTILKALKKATGRKIRPAEVADESDEATKTLPALVQVFLNHAADLMGANYTKRVMNKCMAAIRKSNAARKRAAKADAARQAAAQAGEAAGLAGRVNGARKNSVVDLTDRRQVAVRPGFLRGRGKVIGTVAASALLIFKSSTWVQATVLLSVGILAIGGGIFLTHQVDPEPPATAVVAPPADNEHKTIQEAIEKTYTVSETAISEPEPVEEPVIEEPELPDPFLPQEAYLDAVNNGAIIFTGNDCACGHVNPIGAQALHMDTTQGTVEWKITKESDATSLYSGVGDRVTTALSSLYSAYGNGSYLITFIYTTEDDMRVEKARPIFIDTGVITPNQYE